MKVKVRFFARFRELLGTELIAEVAEQTTLPDLIKQITQKNTEGHQAIFDERGHFREYVIVMRNARRVDLADADRNIVADGDDIAVFPPVAGG
ncbi:MAG TPA: ubiquitin-like small modifier protein 1 [Methanoregula sp.]|nr:ubiquitin-like small modifier protein 1 [Methanoregula sp.]